MLNEDIIVQKSLMPFNNDFETLHLEKCKTIQEIVDKTIPFNFVDARLVVTLNNEVVESDKWDIPLKKGEVVGLNFIPTGGGSGKNTLVQVVAVVATVALTIYTGGGFAAAMQAGAYWEAAGWAAGQIAGSMLINMAATSLMSTPNQASTFKSSLKESQTQFIENAQNAINKYGIIPVNLGTNRMFPPQAVLPYTETSGNNQYCRQIFTYGYGKLKITDRKLGETDISEYEEVEMSDRLNADLNQGTQLYTNDVYQEGLNVKLSKAEGEVIRSTQRDANECELDITFNGLVGIFGYGSYAGTQVSMSVNFQFYYRKIDTTNWIRVDDLTVKAKTRQVLRKVKRIVFPEQGQYEIKIIRTTEDGDGQYKITDSYLTAIRSITYQKPVKFADISGTAMRIKATDQLNGTVSSYNAIVTTLLKGYDPESDSWVDDMPSSNPADLFRYVLQTPAFAKRVTDDKIDLEKLVEWWKYCDSLKLTYNRVIDYETSVDDVLNDICAAGVATLSKVNNIYSVIIDNERPYVKGLVTPRNSWDYSGNINYPEIPHALRIEFRNAEKGYETDERIVYADGYNEENATLFERIEFASCTNADLAYWYGRRYFATALLQPETHTFKMDFENMTFNRGDRISFVNDVILVGVGQGRIKELKIDEQGNILGFFIDDEVNIPDTNKFGVRIRDNNGKGFTYHLLETVVGSTREFTFSQPVPLEDAPALGSLCAFVEDGKELDLIITQIKPTSNQSATITAIDYAPERFKPLEKIPPFDSNITIPGDFYKPYPPLLDGDIVSDESVMIKNSDGSITSVMVIPLKNRNEPSVVPVVKCRIHDTTEWFMPGSLKRDSNQVILTGLEDGSFYDLQIRYQRQSGLQLLSDSLEINNVKFVGGSTPPHDVKDFRVTVTNGLSLFEWTPNEDVDISHYAIRFTADLVSPTWESSQIAVARITGNTVTTVIHKGMYLIKAYDLLGNESRNATTIISTDDGAYQNVVEKLVQEPHWSGRKENLYISENNIRLIDGNTEGFYYFTPEPIDLGEVYECSLTSFIQATIDNKASVREMPRIREVGPIRDFGMNMLIRSVDAIRSIIDIRTFSGVKWSVDLEMNLSDNGTDWQGWKLFTASQYKFRFAMFRLVLFVENDNFVPQVSKASVTIDMPDRYESEEDVQILNAKEGAIVAYKNAFWNNPSVNVTLQDGAVDDRVEFIEKNNKGFTIKIYNDTLQSYVTRSFDYIAAGYGKVI